MHGAKCTEYDANDGENKQNDDQSTAIHRLPQVIIRCAKRIGPTQP
jgi:hypothetical protein